MKMDLNSILDKRSKKSQLILISGESGSGKTTWCKEQIAIVQQKGLKVAGVLSPAIFESGEKVGIALINLATGEKRQLAKLRPQLQPEAIIKKWIMDPEVIVWANGCLEKVKTCDLLIIDELGPLEFKTKEGFQKAFSLIEEENYRLAVVVIRPALLLMASERWQGIPSQVYHIEEI